MPLYVQPRPIDNDTVTLKMNVQIHSLDSIGLEGKIKRVKRVMKGITGRNELSV